MYGMICGMVSSDVWYEAGRACWCRPQEKPSWRHWHDPFNGRRLTHGMQVPSPAAAGTLDVLNGLPWMLATFCASLSTFRRQAAAGWHPEATAVLRVLKTERCGAGVNF